MAEEKDMDGAAKDDAEAERLALAAEAEQWIMPSGLGSGVPVLWIDSIVERERNKRVIEDTTYREDAHMVDKTG